jgi:multidrug efflux system membrane fusion protein
LTTRNDAVVVPNEAVQTGQNGSFIYVVKPDRTVESRTVTQGARVDEAVVIESGLQAGETVVTEGQLRLAPGSRVAVRDGRGGRGGRARDEGGRGEDGGKQDSGKEGAKESGPKS